MGGCRHHPLQFQYLLICFSNFQLQAKTASGELEAYKPKMNLSVSQQIPPSCCLQIGLACPFLFSFVFFFSPRFSPVLPSSPLSPPPSHLALIPPSLRLLPIRVSHLPLPLTSHLPPPTSLLPPTSQIRTSRMHSTLRLRSQTASRPSTTSVTNPCADAAGRLAARRLLLTECVRPMTHQWLNHFVFC